MGRIDKFHFICYIFPLCTVSWSLRVNVVIDLEDNGKGNDLTAAIFKILYATAEGFEAVEDNNTETEQIEDNSQQKDSTVEPEEEAQEEAF